MNKVSSTDVNETDYTDKIDKDGTVNWLPSSLDIRFGNLCNQKCIMCGPHFSNLWYDEYVDYYKTTSFGQGEEIQIKKDIATGKWIEPAELSWYENPIWWDKLNQLAPSLRHVYITGGEPMVTPGHDKMLDVLIESNFSQNIALEYDTNLSAINNKIIDRWHKFKSVVVRISMDATGDKYELIRYGGNWNKFVENIKKLKQYSNNNPKIKIESVTSCVQTLTIYDIIKSEEFCKQIDVHFHIRFLEGPRHLSINHLSKNTKLELIEYYKKYAASSHKAQLIISHLDKHLNDAVDPKEMAEFVRFMDYLDKSRGTNWKQTLPEVFQLITKHS
jgi:MoaA/NifB/PqqE/SkfB family radical SAM enzyme